MKLYTISEFKKHAHKNIDEQMLLIKNKLVKQEKNSKNDKTIAA